MGHDADLQLEQEQQEQFLVEVDHLTACQLESKKMAQQQEDKIEAFTKVEATWRFRVSRVEDLEQQKKAETQKVQRLERELQGRNQELQHSHDMEARLQQDLHEVAKWHET